MKYILFISMFISLNALTLEECIDKTLKYHPEIKTYNLEIEKNEEVKKGIESSYLPQLNFEATYNINQTYLVNGETVEEDGSSIGLKLEQKIYDFGKTSSLVKASEVDKEIVKLSLENSKASLVTKVKQLYKTLLYYNKAKEVREEELKTKEAYYVQAKAMRKEGLKTLVDESRFLSALYSAKENLYISQSEFNKTKESLSLIMGEKIDKHIEIDDSVLKKDFIDKNSIEDNYLLKIESKNIERNKFLQKSSQSQHYGSINGFASYQHIDNLSEYDSKLVGVVLNIPLYTGGKISSDVQQNLINQQIAQTKKEAYSLSLKDEIQSLIFDIKRYNHTILSKQKELELANQSKKVVEGRYKEGLATYIEVLDISSLKLEAELGLLESYYKKSLVIDRVDYLQGSLNE